MSGPDGGWGQFDRFIAHRLPALYRYAYILTGNQHDAEDLVQEALTRTGVAWSRVKRKDDPEAYVRTTMARIMANRWRRPRRERLVADAPELPVEDGALDRVADADRRHDFQLMCAEAIPVRLPHTTGVNGEIRRLTAGNKVLVYSTQPQDGDPDTAKSLVYDLRTATSFRLAGDAYAAGGWFAWRDGASYRLGRVR
jgi:RNA polymerase sigma factor (sigma-70 family)